MHSLRQTPCSGLRIFVMHGVGMYSLPLAMIGSGTQRPPELQVVNALSRAGGRSLLGTQCDGPLEQRPAPGRLEGDWPGYLAQPICTRPVSIVPSSPRLPSVVESSPPSPPPPPEAACVPPPPPPGMVRARVTMSAASSTPKRRAVFAIMKPLKLLNPSTAEGP